MKTAIQLILIGILIMCFSSCKTAEELLNKAEKKDPAIVAKLARDKYPCTDLLKPDTAIVYQDSLVFVDVECPEAGQPAEVIRVDTVNNVITRTVRVPVNMPVQVRTVTRWYEDSAKLKVLTVGLNKANTANEKLTGENTRLHKAATRRGIENWIWRIVAAVLAFFWIKGKLTTIKIQRV